jgi:hypothetical protein
MQNTYYSHSVIPACFKPVSSGAAASGCGLNENKTV